VLGLRPGLHEVPVVSDYPAVRYAQGRKVHYGKPTVGGFIAACGWVPRWHGGARKVDAEVTCGRCLAGPTAWRYPSR
jgi:hypothetical protein